MQEPSDSVYVVAVALPCLEEVARDSEQEIAVAACKLHKTAAALGRGFAAASSVFPGKVSQSSVVDQIRTRRSKSEMQTHARFDRLARLGISRNEILAALSLTKESGATVVDELISASKLLPKKYFQLMASDLGVEYQDCIAPDKILMDMLPQAAQIGAVNQIFVRDLNGSIILVAAPTTTDEAAIRAMISRDPLAKQRIRITNPMIIRSALAARREQVDVERAVNRLNDESPLLSAKQTTTPLQAFILGFCLAVVPVALIIAFWQVMFGLHLIFSIFFLAALGLRLAAWWTYVCPAPEAHVTRDTARYPKYSVMIALHNEAPVVAQLINAMERLEWPKSKIEVLYVCEQDDVETITALEARGLPPGHRIVSIPFALPRTKPKALTYALPHCTGEFVVIFDAEDRPHPLQLKEAWQRFTSEDGTLACLQAPLVIANPEQSWWSRLFAFEYAAHFYGLLPYLARIGAPLPLGGTSNHFRKDVLMKSLCWDPYNVTEDADLGIRLSRMGYRCGVISAATLEDAPTSFKVWLPQRSRWQKGWMQTLLVQNRSLRSIISNIGMARFAIFQVLILSLILSPLLYIIALIEIAAFYILGSNSPSNTYVAQLDFSLFIGGHITFYALATRCEATQSMREHIKMLLSLPIYWIFLSRAAWRAVWQLIFKPHLWEKTPHLPSVNLEVLDLGQ